MPNDVTDNLLALNDLVNAVLNRYDAFVKGDRAATADVAVTCACLTSMCEEWIRASHRQSGGKPKAPETSLIDFDDGAAAEPAETLSDSLAGLQLASSTAPATPSASTRPGALPPDLFGPFTSSSAETTTFGGHVGGLGSIQLGMGSFPATPVASPPLANNLQRPMGAASNRVPGSSMVPGPSRPAPAPTAKKDPFADLADLMG
jgi:hypothetical protein